MEKNKETEDKKENMVNGKDGIDKKTGTAKRKGIRNVITALTVLIVFGVAVIGLWKLSGEGDKPSDILVFKLGTEEVYLDEVHFCILQNMSSLKITAEALQNTTAEDGTNAATYYKQEILDLIMDYKVEYGIAKEQGITLTDEEEKKVRTDVMTYLGQTDARVLNQWGISQELIEEVFLQRYLVSKLEDMVTDEVEVEEQRYCTIYLMLFPKIEMGEDGNYLTEEDGTTPILLTEEEIEQRKRDAEDAWKDLQEGTDVGTVAKKYGVETYSAEESNIAESFGEPFSEYAKSLDEGECSPVLETESCYAIIRMMKENNEEIAKQIMSYYKADLEEEVLEEKKAEWYEKMGVGETPVFEGKTWDKISLYDYVQ